MRKVFGLALLALALAAPVRADDVASGNWKLTAMGPAGNEESTDWVFKLESKDGKTTATLVSANPKMKKTELIDFTMKGDQVRIEVEYVIGKNTAYRVFEGRVSKDGKKIAGTYGMYYRLTAAYLVPTDLKVLTGNDTSHSLGIDPMDKAVELIDAVAEAQKKAQKSGDAASLTKLLETRKKADFEVAKLYREVLEKYPNTYAAGRAALFLLQRKDVGATPAELKSWMATASRAASDFGPVWTAETTVQLVNALLLRKHTDLAVACALAADTALDDKSAIEVQAKMLQTVSRALLEAGKAEDAKRVNDRLAKVDKILDEQYLAKVPPFKGLPYAGRNAQSNRVVVMELFTGAQCPDCIGSDVAFDELLKSYKASELVLLQYHLHIPGPDPMVNPETEARWKYYMNAFGRKVVSGTPTTAFSGTPKPSAGGHMADAEDLYYFYRRAIDPLLDRPAGAKIAASARRVGDKIRIETDVAGLKKPGKEMKLRIALVEQKIRYLGANKIRFHHQVVRAMPGGPEGIPVTEETMSTKNEVDLNDLRKQLTSYLDDYAANQAPFPRPERPLSFQGLRVVAFLQNDTTHEIVQAVQVDVVE